MPKDLPSELFSPEATEVIAGYATSGNEVLRCAALRALAAVAGAAGRARPRLLAALLDPDPDVRTDAMQALFSCATPQDADDLRRSLAGDPVREVKLAAIAALVAIRDADALPLLRKLVGSRTEDEVNWEDEDTDWEDWLDIQIAAIKALGTLGDDTVIEDMLAARDDELAQTLDMPVFEALSQLGAKGVAYLVAIVQTEPALPAGRAAATLQRTDADMLALHLDTLKTHAAPSLRCLAVDVLDAHASGLADLAANDPAPAVRRAALRRAALAQPDLLRSALSDPDPSVQAVALTCLEPPAEAAFRDTVVTNMCAWLTAGPTPLVLASAGALARWAPDRAADPLLRLIQDTDAPLEARVTAVRALDRVQPALPTSEIAALLGNPAQQVRVAALVLLRVRAQDTDPEAIDAVAQAVAGTLLSDSDLNPAVPDAPDGPDMAMPKGEAGGRRTIRITRDGEIVEEDTADAIPARDDASTLAQILAPMAEHAAAETSEDGLDDRLENGGEMAEDTPEERPEKRRKRRAVEGPDAICEALSLEAMQICGHLADPQIAAACLGHAHSPDDPLRRAAWQALQGASTPSDGILAAARAVFRDADPVVRLASFRILMAQQDDAQILADAQTDADPLLRAEAVDWAASSALPMHLGDDALAVRAAAATRLCATGTPAEIVTGVEHVLSAERSDTLATLIAHSADARARAIDLLAASQDTPKRAFVLLNALAVVPNTDAQRGAAL